MKVCFEQNKKAYNISIMKKEVKFAFVKTSPIMVSYFFVSCAYGLVMAQGGFGWGWSMLVQRLFIQAHFKWYLHHFLQVVQRLLP